MKKKVGCVILVTITLLITSNNRAFADSRVTNFFNIFLINHLYSDYDIIAQDRTQNEFEYMMSELQRVHKALYGLPYSYDYIKETLVVKVEAKKTEIAPHFPNRADYGTDSEKGNQLFKEWFLTYPTEWRLYVNFLDDFILENSK